MKASGCEESESAACTDRGAGCWRDERSEETEADAPPPAVLRLWSRSTRNNLGHSLQWDYRYGNRIHDEIYYTDTIQEK